MEHLTELREQYRATMRARWPALADAIDLFRAAGFTIEHVHYSGPDGTYGTPESFDRAWADAYSRRLGELFTAAVGAQARPRGNGPRGTNTNT